MQTQGIKVDRERVQARVMELAEGYPNPEEARRAYQHNRDAMRTIESAVLEDQVVDWVLARARVTERAMSFSELTGFGKSEADQEPQHQHEPRHDPQYEPQQEQAGET